MAPKKAKSLTRRQLESLAQKIKEQYQNLIFKGVYLSDEFNLCNEDRSDEVDQANAEVSNAQRLRFRNRENFYSKKLAQSLDRIKDGIYGLCEECEGPITFKRLFARPTAEKCIICKEESERDEHLNILGRQSKSIGAKMELKQSM